MAAQLWQQHLLPWRARVSPLCVSRLVRSVSLRVDFEHPHPPSPPHPSRPTSIGRTPTKRLLPPPRLSWLRTGPWLYFVTTSPRPAHDETLPTPLSPSFTPRPHLPPNPVSPLLGPICTNASVPATRTTSTTRSTARADSTWSATRTGRGGRCEHPPASRACCTVHLQQQLLSVPSLSRH